MVTVVTEAEQVAEYVARSTYTQTEYALQDSILTVSKYCISLTYYKVSYCSLILIVSITIL